MLTFSQWLEEAGEVNTAYLTNTAVDDRFQTIRSKYMANHIRQKKEHDPEKLFGKRKKTINKRDTNSRSKI